MRRGRDRADFLVCWHLEVFVEGFAGHFFGGDEDDGGAAGVACEDEGHLVFLTVIEDDGVGAFVVGAVDDAVGFDEEDVLVGEFFVEAFQHDFRVDFCGALFGLFGFEFGDVFLRVEAHPVHVDFFDASFVDDAQREFFAGEHAGDDAADAAESCYCDGASEEFVVSFVADFFEFGAVEGAHSGGSHGGLVFKLCGGET